MKKKKAAKGIMLDVCIMLICLIVVSTCLASGVFAKFASAARGSNNPGRVAVFDVNASAVGDISNLVINANENTSSFKLKVSSDSETAVKYTLKLTFDKDVSAFMTAAIGGAAGTIGADPDGNTTFTWTDLGTFAPGAQEEELTLVLTLDRGAAVFGSDDYNFAAVVTFAQVD